MFASAQWLLVGLIVPRVENPWPESIGLGFPFTLAGAFGVLADVVYAEAPQVERDRAINSAGVRGFRAGAGLYVLALAVQVASGL